MNFGIKHWEKSIMSSFLVLRTPCFMVSVLMSLLAIVEPAASDSATADQLMSAGHQR